MTWIWFLFGITSGISICAAAFYLAILIIPDEDKDEDKDDCDRLSGPW